MAALFLLKAAAVCLIIFLSCGRNRNAMLPGDFFYCVFSLLIKTEYSKHNFCARHSSVQVDEIHFTTIILSHLVHQFPIPCKNPGITVITDEAPISGINTEVVASLLCLIKKITYHLST